VDDRQLTDPDEQELLLVDSDVQITRTDIDDDPPQFTVEMLVAHEETGITWMQLLRMNKQRFTHLVKLMTFVAHNEHIDTDPSSPDQ